MNEGITITLDLPASHRYLNVLSACIVEMARRAEMDNALEARIYELQLAAHEVAANIVDHAYSGRVDGRISTRMRYLESENVMTLDFIDDGVPFEEPQAVALPELDDLSEGGMGFFLAYQLVDSLTYQRSDHSNLWQLTKRLG